jgi:hypothetical protein
MDHYRSAVGPVIRTGMRKRAKDLLDQIDRNSKHVTDIPGFLFALYQEIRDAERGGLVEEGKAVSKDFVKQAEKVVKAARELDHEFSELLIISWDELVKR